MAALSYMWRANDLDHYLLLVRVPGTNGQPYLFGREPDQRPIDVPDFYISSTPVTQAFWEHVMGSNPSAVKDLRCPVENVSWDLINGPGGFLDQLNLSAILTTVVSGESNMRFRLPSETEWEYAARGGPNWSDGYVYSGSNDPDTVAWFGPRWTTARSLAARLFGPRLGWHIFGRVRFRWPTRTHPVGMKAPNQLGLYDMSGNVWEWCHDVCIDDINAVPGNGKPYSGPGDERRLRGGCHHNWNLHCTVSWRYGISPDAHDGCIGFRLALVRETATK